MAVDSHDPVGVLVDDDAAGIHAEGPDQVVVSMSPVYYLALVKLIRYVGEDGSRQFDSDADIHPVALRGDVKFAAYGLHPFASGSSGRDDTVSAVEVLFFGDYPVSVIKFLHGQSRRQESEIDPVLKLAEEVLQHDIVNIGPEVPYRGVQQVQIVLKTLSLEIGTGRGVEFCALSAVGHVDAVDVVHELQRLVFADVLMKCAAEVIGYVVLAV